MAIVAILQLSRRIVVDNHIHRQKANGNNVKCPGWWAWQGWAQVGYPDRD